jgi:RimJ/RimL family protein N-acetyltransferase
LKKGDGSPSPFLLATTMNPILQTERLILRPFSEQDAPRVRVLAGDFEVAKMCRTIPHPYPEGEAEAWIGNHAGWRQRGSAYPFAIELGGALVGSVGFGHAGDGEFDLGYWLGCAYWGRGYATEAVRAVLAFAFDEVGLAYVRARFITENRASGRVLGKVGFLATERQRKFHPVQGVEVELTHAVLPQNAFLRDDPGTKQVYKAA